MEQKIRRIWNQSRYNTQDKMGKAKYMIFHGNEENFIRNGALVLEESISLFHGRRNPIRHFSIDDMNNMNVERLAYYKEGGFNLYQGSWDERLVSVKMPRVDKQGFNFVREIVVAAEMAAHNNVQKLLGCCLETKSPVLVYEWVAAKTLDEFIFLEDENDNAALLLKWNDRLRIAREISHAVAYLHTAFPRPIIHRDLKLKNVVLDLDTGNAAKLGDFSLCVSIPEGEEFVQESLAGTFGYIAPEYAMHEIVAESTDVYSFGMLLLVLLTGKKPFVTQEKHKRIQLQTWIRSNFISDSNSDKNINKILDPAIVNDGITAIEDLQLRASIRLALLCTTVEEYSRPTMVEVATQLHNFIRSPESILTFRSFQVGLLYRIFCGNKENYIKNEALLQKESNWLSRSGKPNPIHYFSIDDLNNMSVEYEPIFWGWKEQCAWYRGSWKGEAVSVKLQQGVTEALKSSDNKRSHWRYLREIVVATELAAHSNVQKLLGCCLETKIPVLVYEWVAAETLEDRILLGDENITKRKPLEWQDRLRIAWEISHVISYLHTVFPSRMIYKNLEPYNVLLDQENSAKLCNFSHSVYIPKGKQNVVEESAIGTWDYLPPGYEGVAEYTDVYSFGMLFLVLLTGKDPKSCELRDWVIKEMRDKGISEIMDSAISKNGVATTTELSTCLKLALRCTEEEIDRRPTMVEVATELNIIREGIC